MSYLALYRRYRPDTFDKLVGQDHIVKTLVNQITGNRLGHAYLFTGTRGTGKTSAAKIFAKAINCQNPVNGSPCGTCESCRALSDPSNIDIIEIDAASNNGVNEIRELREKVQYPPVSCKYKVYIVDEVHMLTGPAFNALLKTLEEPPKHAVFILATTEVHKIPATILSRCMRFDFRLIPTERIAKLISSIYDEQGKQYEGEAVMAIANAGEGSIRDALSIADIALSYGKGKLTYDEVMEILGSTNFCLLSKFIHNILLGNTGEILEAIDKLVTMGKSMGVLTKDVTAIVRNLLIIKTCDNANDILSLPKDKFDSLSEIADSTSSERLVRILEIFSQTESLLRYTTHPRVVFETASVKAARLESDYDFDAMLSRIKELEEKIKNGNFSVKQVPTESTVKKEVEEPKKEEVKPSTEKLSIATATLQDVNGKLLHNLRLMGREMLWNVMQSIKLTIDGNNLKFTTFNQGDEGIIEKNRETIIKALDDFLPFNIIVEAKNSQENIEEIDDEAEKIKKIFGDDIVILK
ncbi:MAG: DNA polymerase III subunit gamma/tau [Clostridiales bacterium]|nr:DNA polymerase III subunit gamma/tau [Clostridiales bacterium]